MLLAVFSPCVITVPVYLEIVGKDWRGIPRHLLLELVRSFPSLWLYPPSYITSHSPMAKTLTLIRAINILLTRIASFAKTCFHISHCPSCRPTLFVPQNVAAPYFSQDPCTCSAVLSPIPFVLTRREDSAAHRPSRMTTDYRSRRR